MVSDPLNKPIEYGLDLISIGKLYAQLGYLDEAVKIYRAGMDYEDVPENVYWQILCDLSFIHKKQGDMQSAIDLWLQAADQEQIYAHEELAKFCEHVEKDYQNAYHWTTKAIRILNLKTTPAHNRVQWLDSLNHRKNRLERKLADKH
jgi:tetratricopeptide (TPR) repeat protein